MLIEAPGKGVRPAPQRHPHHQRKKQHEIPNWVIRSRAPLALQADSRFKTVRLSTTQPGVVMLEGEVFDDAAKAAAEQTVVGVQGVKRVINALTTETLNGYCCKTASIRHCSRTASPWSA
jgi:BON domain-containing protein